MSITGINMTLEQFLALPDAKPALEYTPESCPGEGATIRQKMRPDVPHALIATALVLHLDEWARASGIGRALLEVTIAVAGHARVPDVGLYRREDIVGGVEYPTAAPLIAAEILSPGETRHSRREKCRWYVEHGSALALFIDPHRRLPEVQAFWGDAEHTYEDDEPIGKLAELCNGLQLTPEQLFEELLASSWGGRRA